MRRTGSWALAAALGLAVLLASAIAAESDGMSGGGGWRLNRFGDAAEAVMRADGRALRQALLVGRDNDAAQAHLVHSLALRAGHRYRLRVPLSGEAGGQLHLMVRRSAAPFDVVVQQEVQLDGGERSVELQWVAYDDSDAFDLRIVPRSPRLDVRAGEPKLEDLGATTLGDGGVAAFDPRLLGLHLNRFAQYRTVPEMHVGLVRIWDMRTNWNHLAPTPEAWKSRSGDAWTRLDELVDTVRRRAPDATLLMTLGQPPAWASASPGASCPYGTGTCGAPASLDAWRDYVETLARRYKGRIRDWELWNEPDYKRFFVPTVSLVDLAKVASEALKSVDPQNRLVSPGFTSNGLATLDRFLAQGGGRYVDAIGFHWYALGAPEALMPRIRAVRAVMQRHGAGQLPLWDTEGAPWCIPGGRAPCAFDGLERDELDALPMRYVLTMWLEGVQAAAYYTAEGANGRSVMLFDPDRRAPTRAGTAWAALAEWLRGVRSVSVEAWGEGGHAVHVQAADGPAVLVWSERAGETLRVPAGWGVARQQSPWSEPAPLRAGEPLTVGRVPLRLSPAAR